jgi:hypothetical protein
VGGDLLRSVVNRAFNCNEKNVSRILYIVCFPLHASVRSEKVTLRCSFFIWSVRQARRQGLVIFFCTDFACAAQGRACKTLFWPGFHSLCPARNCQIRFIISFRQ